MEVNKRVITKVKSDSKEGSLFEISWNTVSSYLKEKCETPIPMYGSYSCVLLVKPKARVELQMRTEDAFGIETVRLPQLARFHYEYVATKSYKYLAIICGYSEFDETVLKFFNSIALNFVVKQLSADLSIMCAYAQWRKMLEQLQLPDENTLTGIWGEMFIIDLVLESKNIDAICLMQNWTGPLGAANDFSFGSSCIEVKATTKQSNIVEISSIDQLDAKQAWIILQHVFHAPSESGGKTIAALVDKISSKLDSAALELFNERIGNVLDISSLSQINYFSLKSDTKPVAIKVDNTFPVLTRSQITKLFDPCSASMLCGIKYSLDLTDKLAAGTNDIPSLF